MSDLQIALMLIGGFIVVAVLLFNWVQERRYKKQADAALKPIMRDPLLDTAATPKPTDRIEPKLREPQSASAATQPIAPAAVAPEPVVPAAREHASPVLRDAPSAAPSKNMPSLGPIPPAPYDELIEYRIRVEGKGILGAVFAEDINAARTLGKHTRWLGYPEQGDEWEEIQPWRETFYREVQVTIQLVDRNGAVQESELYRLNELLAATAARHGLHVVAEDISEAMQRAQSVDHFCVDVDVLIGLNVVGNGDGGMKLAKILKEVESSGMMLGVDGAYRLLDSRGEALYSLCNHDAEPFSPTAPQPETQAVTLQFDVPRVPDGLKVFDGMVSFGRKLANEVGGLLVDDNMRPLTDSGIDKIRQQLAGIYQRMEARGVPSGSRRALRLFS